MISKLLIGGAMIAYARGVVAVLEKVLLMEIPVSVMSFKIYMLGVISVMKAISSFDEWVDAQY